MSFGPRFWNAVFLILLAVSVPAGAAEKKETDSVISKNLYSFPLTYVEKPAGYRPEPPGYQEKPAGYREAPPGNQEKPAGYRETLPGYLETPPGFSPTPPDFIEKDSHPQVNKNEEFAVTPDTHPSKNSNADWKLTQENHPRAEKEPGLER